MDQKIPIRGKWITPNSKKPIFNDIHIAEIKSKPLALDFFVFCPLTRAVVPCTDGG